MNVPLRIQNQSIADECTSCALAAIAEDVIGQPIDPEYLYNNSKKSGFGITEGGALKALFEKGVVKVGSTTPLFPFSCAKGALPWIFRFDSMIRMLNRNDRSFFCGCYWQSNWTNAPGGICTMPTEWNTWFPHAFKIFGYVLKPDGIMYLKVQNSVGTDKGDGGIWYMPKEIITKLNFAYQLL